MSRRVVWSRDALDEIKEIAGYIARDNPQAARKVATCLRDTGARLGVHATGRPGRVSGTFEQSIRGLPYVAAYAVRNRPDGGQELVILRIIHTSRHWPKEGWPET